MAPPNRRAQRRTDALTRDRIVEAAVDLLDEAGERGLTFRALTERLATGPGAIYWHVPNKDELLAAATDAVIAEALAAGPHSDAPRSDAPREEVRALSLGLFAAINRHPWLAGNLAAQLARGASAGAAPRIFESLGRRVRALGVPAEGWFVATSALVHYVLGAAGQNAANAATARSLGSDVDRSGFLESTAAAWEGLDPEDFPVVRSMAGQLRDHDDREQFLGGVDLVLAGITATYAAG